MDAHMGDGVQPEAGGRVDGSQTREVQAIEEAFFDIPHIVLDPPLGLGLANSTGLGREAMMGGKVQISFVEEGAWPTECRRTAVFKWSLRIPAGTKPK